MGHKSGPFASQSPSHHHHHRHPQHGHKATRPQQVARVIKLVCAVFVSFAIVVQIYWAWGASGSYQHPEHPAPLPLKLEGADSAVSLETRIYDHEHRARDKCSLAWDHLTLPVKRPAFFRKKFGAKAIREAERGWREFAAAIPPYQTASGVEPGSRGIVVSAGAFNFKQLLLQLRMLRFSGCKLPVEVWHFPGELNASHVPDLHTLHAVARNIGDVRGPLTTRMLTTKKHENYNIKSTAIANSGFEEVLWMDADNLPARDPSYLFDTPEYRSTGAMFFPDFWKTHSRNQVYDVLKVPCLDEFEFESGQMVLDKTRVWPALSLAWYMNNQSAVYYQLLHGDKDTFRFAFKALGLPYHFIREYLATGGFTFQRHKQDLFCGHSMLQHDPNQQVVFVHANLIKYFVYEQKGFDRKRPWTVVQKFSHSPNTTNAHIKWVDLGPNVACVSYSVDVYNPLKLLLGGRQPKGSPAVEVIPFEEYVPAFYSLFYQADGPSVMGWEDFNPKKEEESKKLEQNQQQKAGDQISRKAAPTAQDSK